MADNKIPDSVKQLADTAVARAGVEKMAVQAEKQSPAVDSLGDGGRALALAKEQARQQERAPANHDHKQPGKE